MGLAVKGPLLDSWGTMDSVRSSQSDESDGAQESSLQNAMLHDEAKLLVALFRRYSQEHRTKHAAAMDAGTGQPAVGVPSALSTAASADPACDATRGSASGGRRERAGAVAVAAGHGVPTCACCRRHVRC
eukprot:3876490-Rhodomonas_salina.8